jgi:hypothetical protein
LVDVSVFAINEAKALTAEAQRTLRSIEVTESFRKKIRALVLESALF